MNEIFSFGQRYYEAKMKHLRLERRVPQLGEEYGNLQEAKNRLVGFCEQHGISAITSQQEYEQKRAEIKSAMETHSLKAALGSLREISKHASTGRRLVNEANLYLRAKAKAGKPPEQLNDEELNNLGYQIEFASPWADQENAAATLREKNDVQVNSVKDIFGPLGQIDRKLANSLRLRSKSNAGVVFKQLGFQNMQGYEQVDQENHDGFNDSLVMRVGQSENQYPQDEASFALHRETIILERLLPELANVLGERIGLRSDALMSGNGINNVVAEQIEKFALPPAPIKQLQERGLADFKINDYGFDGNISARMATAITMLLPDGKSEKIARTYLDSVETKLEKRRIYHETYETERSGLSEYEEYEDARIEESKQSFLLRRELYRRVVNVFSQVKEPTYPHFERKARELASYIIGPEDSIVLQRITKDRGKPLAESVITVKTLAFNEGLDMNPLIDEMRREIQEQHHDPQQVADKLEKTKQLVEHRQKILKWRDYDDVELDRLKDTVDWFIEETFCGNSRLDQEGKLLRKKSWENDRFLPVRRHPQAVQQVIDALREMPAVEK